MNRPSPGTEGYWSELAEDYTPQPGDIARIRTLDSEPAVYVLKADHVDEEVRAYLLADLDQRRVEMILDAAPREREAFVALIEKSHERQDTTEVVVPTADLDPVLARGGESV